MLRRILPALAAAGFSLAGPPDATASSHMDAPLIVLDDAANTTDVYAFVREQNGRKSLVTALGVYPFEEPGIGPNKFNFDDNVLYAIHVALGKDVAAGRPTLSYEFRFTTRYKNRRTILQSYLGVVNDVNDANQNLTQFYSVTKVDHRSGKRTPLGSGIVPPNNQGIATPFYNQGDDGEQPAKEGVATADQLDRYTQQAIASLDDGYLAFAGQRDDGFYGGHPGRLRSAAAAQSRPGFAAWIQPPPDGARHPDRRAWWRHADGRRLRDDEPRALDHPVRRSAQARGRRRLGPGRASGQSRCSTKASWRSRTRTSTAARRRRSTTSCSASTRRIPSSRSC